MISEKTNLRQADSRVTVTGWLAEKDLKIEKDEKGFDRIVGYIVIKNSDKISNIKLWNKILDNISLIKENIELIKYTKTYELPFSIDELKLNIDENIKTMDLLKKCGIKKS